MKRLVGVLCAVVGTGVSMAGMQGGKTSIFDGVFSEDQANRGEVAYQASCSACHGPELIPVDSEPPALTGPKFNFSWVGKTVGERYEKMRTTMPATNPGSLDDTTNADILAYILKFNGYPAGSQDLSADKAKLDGIVIEQK